MMPRSQEWLNSGIADHHQGWQLNTRIEQELTRLELNADAP